VTERDKTDFCWDLETLVLESSIMGSIRLNRCTWSSFRNVPCSLPLGSSAIDLSRSIGDMVVGFQCVTALVIAILWRFVSSYTILHECQAPNLPLQCPLMSHYERGSLRSKAQGRMSQSSIPIANFMRREFPPLPDPEQETCNHHRKRERWLQKYSFAVRFLPQSCWRTTERLISTRRIGE
jgi:hypothetical protein